MLRNKRHSGLNTNLGPNEVQMGQNQLKVHGGGSEGSGVIRRSFKLVGLDAQIAKSQSQRFELETEELGP